MRAIALAAVAVMTVVLPVPAAANPGTMIVCGINSLLTGQPADGVDCILQNTDACGEIFDGTTLHSFPCPVACTLPPPNWNVLVGRTSTTPGDTVTGELRCNGVPALSATTNTGPPLVMWGSATGPVAATGTMTCTATNVPSTVIEYFVVCLP